MADKKLKIKVSPTARIKGDKWTEYMKNIKKDKSGARAKESSGGRIGLQGGGAVLKGKKVGIQIK